MFGRKRKQELAARSRFVECRSWYGVAYHIRDTSSDGHALCGYSPLDDRGPATVESVVAGLPWQHDGWRYCSSCLELFLPDCNSETSS